jgi:DNA-binding LacI/PurR family transcriptional regulator
MHRLPQKSSLVAQTAAILRERIEAGEWHRWLPGEHELSAQLHVARMTLRRALDQLQRSGLVRASQGKRREITERRRRRATPAVSGRVLLLTPTPLNFLAPFHVLLTNELRDELERAGFHLEIHSERGAYGRGWSRNLKRLIQQLRPAGCVLVASTEKMQLWFSRHRLPCVIVGSRHPGVEVPSVDKAHRAACRHAVGLFLARGYRRLVLLNPDSGLAGDLESEEGFREGAAQTTRDDVRSSVVRHDGTVADICSKLQALFRRRDLPTGLLVSRAVNVLTVMGHLMRCSLRLPEDVALISRDHEPFLERMVPSVAHYVISPENMARRISVAMLEMVQSKLVSAVNYQIMPEFMEGETLGPKRADAAAPEPSGAA